MPHEKANAWRRRKVLIAAGCAGASAALGLRSGPTAADPPPETRRIRIPQIAGTRSLNIAVAAGIGLAEALRQTNGWPR